VATASVTLDGPTDWRIATHAVRWLGYVRGTGLPSTNRDILGFNSFAEIGGGLQLIAPDVIRGVQGGTVRASAIVGPGPAEIGTWFEQAAQAWNQQPAPFVWHGKRRQRRRKRRGDTYAAGGSAAYASRPFSVRQSRHHEWHIPNQVTH
jgi:hypothetical protein